MRLMNNVLSEYLDKFVVVFLDDVLIYSKSEADHVQHVEMVLNKLRAANLHVKMSKCKFAQSSTTFLGYVVSAEGLKVDPRKIAAVADWPTPTDLHSVRSFLGFCGFYRRFVKDYAKIAHALTELTKTTVPFPKTLPQAALDAFHLLKAALTTTPVLAIPFTGPDATFELYTDASGKGLGAVLLQDQGKGPQPVCYESRKLIPAECNYPVHEQELLAVVYACKKFRHYLDGCKHFKLYTDHHSLRFFFSQRDLSKRQARWSQVLAEFQPNMEIMYRPGPDNQADALSRLFPLDLPTPDPKTHTLLTDLLSTIYLTSSHLVTMTTLCIPQTTTNDPSTFDMMSLLVYGHSRIGSAYQSFLLYSNGSFMSTMTHLQLDTLATLRLSTLSLNGTGGHT